MSYEEPTRTAAGESAVRITGRGGDAADPRRGGRGPGSARGGVPVVIDRFWELSEFLVLAVLALAILVAGAIAEDIDGARAWTLVAVLGAAYILSRGLARRDRERVAERTGDDRERFGR